MKGIIGWMARNHVAANLLMMVFVVGGLVMSRSIKQEIFPEISLDTIQVAVAYPGAAPEEVEEGILLKIEENLTEVDGIKEIKSKASEGFGSVLAVVREGADADLVLQDIKNAVDRITTFPEDAEEPIISKLLNRHEVISVVVYGNLSMKSLREWAERIRDDLLEEPNITQVDLSGVRPYEISIEVPEENLRKYNLTLDQVANAVRNASQDIPGGIIKTKAAEILVRTKEKRYFGPEYEDIIVVARDDGTRIRLGDIATVKDSFEDTDLFAEFDSMPAAMIKVFRVGNQKPIEISDTVKRYVREKSRLLPESVHLATWNDTSEMLKSRMDLLKKNALLGLGLVILVLGLFLEIRLALWVMVGIPVSFLGALFLMPVMGLSINMIALFAFIMALGIVVDDAIVVGENIYEHRQKGKPFLRAAIDGATEVGGPVIFSILTTVVAFIPLIFVKGLVGKFIVVIPLVMISILIISLIESLFVLPAHLSLGSPREDPRGILKLIDGVRLGFGKRLNSFVSGPYRRLLTLCLEYRYVSIAAALSMLLLTAGLVKGGLIKFTFMPEVDGDVILVSLEMPVGTPVHVTDTIQKHIVEKGLEVISEYDRDREDGSSVLRHVYSVVGGTLAKGGPVGSEGAAVSSRCDIAMFLRPSEERGVPAMEISNKWRAKVGELPGIESITFQSNLVHLGANIDIQLAHEDFEVLSRAAEQVKKSLSSYPGVHDITDNYTLGKKELKVRLKPEAKSLGITETDLGRQIRAAFYGSEALRLQRGRNEVKVMVRYPDKDRRSLWNLESMRIRTPKGGEIPIDRAAYIYPGRRFSTINRFNRKRVINVTASVDSKSANAEDILKDLRHGILAQLVNDYPGLTYNLEGEEKERQESMGSMQSGFLLALFGIYALLAIPFRSYSQPLLIMAAIPFGMVGAILGHVLMGYNLSILSVFGIVALSGVVVNDSLLLIDKINKNRSDGYDDRQAVIEACMRRFRPILLTSLTTFLGLTPMILETSVQAQFLIPMAISLGFGILFATGITLFLIPTFCMTLMDVKKLMAG